MPSFGIAYQQWIDVLTHKLIHKTNADTVPTGVINAYWGTVSPAGWLLCDGAAIPSQYTALIALVGANTPDLKGRVIVGLDAGQTEFTTLGQTGGSKTIVTGDLAVHGHGLNNHAHGGGSGLTSANHVHSTNGISTTHTHHPQAKVRTNNTAHAHDNDSAEHSTSPSGAGTSFGTANVITDGDSVDHSHGNTNGASADHTHAVSGDNGVTTNTGSGTVGGKLSPYMAIPYIIKT